MSRDGAGEVAALAERVDALGLGVAAMAHRVTALEAIVARQGEALRRLCEAVEMIADDADMDGASMSVEQAHAALDAPATDPAPTQADRNRQVSELIGQWASEPDDEPYADPAPTSRCQSCGEDTGYPAAQFCDACDPAPADSAPPSRACPGCGNADELTYTPGCPRCDLSAGRVATPAPLPTGELPGEDPMPLPVWMAIDALRVNGFGHTGAELETWWRGRNGV